MLNIFNKSMTYLYIFQINRIFKLECLEHMCLTSLINLSVKL